METTSRWLAFVCAGLLAVSSGCVSGYGASHPLYDFDNVFLNGDMRGQLPWKAPDRVALRQALDTRTAPLSRARSEPRRRHTLTPARSKPAPPRTHSRTLPNHIAAHVAQPLLGRVDDTKPPARLKGVILGDGTARGELRAAAKRLVGLGPAITPVAFVQHLERAADVVLPRSPSGGGVQSVWEGLRARGATYTGEERTPVAGDLVFFHGLQVGESTQGEAQVMGVVSRALDDETLLCVVPVMNAVRAIYLTPGQPNVRRRDGRTMNSPVRARHRNEGANAPRLSGQLLAGFARL